MRKLPPVMRLLFSIAVWLMQFPLEMKAAARRSA